MPTKQNLIKHRDQILRLASNYGINRVRIFGSAARGEATKNSDIDLLVNFSEGRTLFDLIAFKNDVEDLLNRKVDVVSENSLHWYIKDMVIQEAVEL